MVAGAKIFLASLWISRNIHQICVVRSGKVREKCAEKVRESQGFQIELTGGNPVLNSVVNNPKTQQTDCNNEISDSDSSIEFTDSGSNSGLF